MTVTNRWVLPAENAAIDGTKLVVSHISDRPHLVNILSNGFIELEDGTTCSLEWNVIKSATMSERWLLVRPGEETPVDGTGLVVWHDGSRPHQVDILGDGAVDLERGPTWIVRAERDR